MKSANEMGQFLRSRRLRLVPDELGLTSLRKRRTGGLRREEVAALAGISTDWYIRLEQGRAVSPSMETIEGLCLALRLTDAERLHLHRLAGGNGHVRSDEQAPSDGLVQLIGALAEPAYLTSASWDVLAWNGSAMEWFVDFAALAKADRNLMLWMFTNDAAKRTFLTAWEPEALRMLALYRVSYDLHVDDPALQVLTTRLIDQSVVFAQWWPRHDVAQLTTGQKTLHHPVHGARVFRYSSFQSNENPAWKLSLYAQRSDLD